MAERYKFPVGNLYGVPENLVALNKPRTELKRQE